MSETFGSGPEISIPFSLSEELKKKKKNKDSFKKICIKEHIKKVGTPNSECE